LGSGVRIFGASLARKKIGARICLSSLLLLLLLAHEECFPDSCSEETDSENEGKREEAKERRGD
jgi:hypothetical protein